MGGLVRRAAVCWVGMTTASPPGARRPRIRVGTHCAAGSKNRRGRAKGVTHPSHGNQPGRSAGQRPRLSRAGTERQGPKVLRTQHQLSGASRLTYQLVSQVPSLTLANCHSHSSHRSPPWLRPPRSLGSHSVLLCDHGNYSAPWAGGSTSDTSYAQRLADYNFRRAPDPAPNHGW